MNALNNLKIDTETAATTGSTASLTFKEAIMRIASRSDLSDTRRRDIVSALSSVAKWCGRPAGDIPLTPAFLREHFLCKAPAAFGVSPARKTNVKTDIGFAMKQLGLIDETDRTLCDEWAALLAPIDPHRRINQNTFARYCDKRGISPDKVRPETYFAFESHLVLRTIVPNPKKVAGEVRAQWNKFVASVVGWPQTLLVRPHDPTDYVLPLRAFQQSFQDDLKKFATHLSGSVLDDPFAEDPFAGEDDDEAPLPSSKPLRASTVNGRLDHARWAASGLVAAGVAIETIVDLRCLVHPVDHARLILKFLHERAGRKASATGQHVSDVLRIIARHYIRAPLQDIEKIKRWSKPVQLHYRGMTEKNERTVREVLTPEREAKLLLLPGALMQAARMLREKFPSTAASIAMRALAIEILTKLPMRLENLDHLNLDQHLHRTGGRRSMITHIDIPVAEVKNSRALSMPVPAATAELMAEWIEYFRPIIALPGASQLFPGAKSAERPITPQGMRDAVKGVMRDHVGVVVTPQQFRHIAARQFLREFPGHYEEVRQILGHATVETTVRSYSGIESESAIQRHDEVLSSRLKALGIQRRKMGKGR